MTQPRRSHPRVRVDGELRAEDVRSGRAFTVVDLSLGGLALETDTALGRARERNLRLHGPAGDLLVRAKVTRVDGPIPRHGRHVYRTAMEFLPLTPSDRAWLEERVEALQRRRTRGSGEPPAVREVSRRRLPRFDAFGAFSITLDDGDMPMTLQDVGPGGFAADGPTELTRGSIHRVTFVNISGLEVHLRASVAHSRRLQAPSGEPTWRTGFEFLLDTDDASHAVNTVLDHATASLSFV